MTATPDNDDDLIPEAGRPTTSSDESKAGAASSDSTSGAFARARDGIGHARGAVADAYASGRDRAADAYATAREKARAATHSATESLDSNPLGALLGGLALGAVIGALLPRTERENKVLGAVGDKLQGAAREAAGAARDAGRSKLAELGISGDHARDTLRSVIDGVIAAVSSASTAAMDTARKPPADDEKA